MKSPWNTAAIAVPELDFETPAVVTVTPDDRVNLRIWGAVTVFGDPAEVSRSLYDAAQAIEDAQYGKALAALEAEGEL